MLALVRTGLSALVAPEACRSIEYERLTGFHFQLLFEFFGLAAARRLRIAAEQIEQLEPLVARAKRLPSYSRCWIASA